MTPFHRSAARALPLALAAALLAGCAREDSPAPDALADLTPREQVDSLSALISYATAGLEHVATIDHSRLAAEEGVTMPPSLVTMYSDRAVNSALIAVDSRIGLDLPFRVLAYEEPGTGKAVVTYAEAEFLSRRHGLSDPGLLEGYAQSLEPALAGIPPERRAPADASRVDRGYGMIEIPSDLPFESTIASLKKAVLAQTDTKWFGEVDFQADAATLGIELPKTTLLLFGGPGPGGRAMAEFPRLGLDAFCQKLLVYEEADGSVRVAFNDIAAFAELHYGRSTPIHQGLNARLTETFSAAVQGP